ncbi:MAG: beta-ketoacyl synthase chain length factor [Flavobacteriales bacterium]|nr:beta-ketoacyl synthase chain length factor [Flavobacteriales bacterium]
MYIIQCNSISAQHDPDKPDLSYIPESVDNALFAKEPKYSEIPTGVLRRMGKAVRMGVGASLPILRSEVDGIVIGTANGGMEDCIKFLNQIVKYDEGRLTPTNFVQSTNNAVAAQIGLLGSNNGYNITHVHRGLAFENALLDVYMKIKEDPGKNYLLGGLDEISDYNRNIEIHANAYKKETVNNLSLYESNTAGTIAGEGVAMFLAGGDGSNAICEILAIEMGHFEEESSLKDAYNAVLIKGGIEPEEVDLFLSGENGDIRLRHFYEFVESQISPEAGIARFKHVFGEFPTSIACALWLVCEAIKRGSIPNPYLKRKSSRDLKNVLIYNTYKGRQHGFILLRNSMI